MTARRLGTVLIVLAAACGPSDAPNRPPVVSGSPQSTPEDVPLTATVTASDPDGDALTFSYSTPVHGQVMPAGATFTYVPDPDYHGTDTVTVTALDGEAQATATISIDVTPVNDAPTAAADQVIGFENTRLVVPAATLLGNDVDVDGDVLAVTAVGAGTGGVATLAGAAVEFEPSPGFVGSAGFTYTVSDGQATASAAVAVTIEAVDDPPVAVDDVATTAEDTALTVPAATLLANDRDPEAQPLTVVAVGPAAHGTVALAGASITFTPAADYAGPAGFGYTISDGTNTASGTVAVTVTPVNDAPVATPDAVTTAEDTPLVVPAATLAGNDVDVDGDALTVTAVGGAVDGAVALAGGVVTFTPVPNLTGTARFTYTVSDGAASATGLVMVTVTPVPDAPVAGDDTATTAEDTPLVIATSALLANDADVDGPALAVIAVAAPQHGTVALVGTNVTFTPAADYAGPASFTYTVSDGSLTDTGLVQVTVTPVDDAPVAVDDLAVTAEDTAVIIAATALTSNDTDVDGPALTVTAVGNPLHGTVALAGGVATFTPAVDYAGPASFEYTVSDGTLADVGQVAVTVTPVDDAPVAQAGTASTLENVAVTITVTAGDVDSPAVTFAAAAPDRGTLGPLTAIGPFAATATYTPPPGYAGPAAFTFTASDGTLTSAPATIAITVVNVPMCGDGVVEAPEACDDAGTAAGDGCGPACAVELGWSCAGSPSACAPVCGDGLPVGGEACDDGNLIDTDGCTTACVAAPPCTAAAHPGGDRFVTAPTTGTCYVGFDGEVTTFAAAEVACEAGGGHLATITSAAEQALVTAAASDSETPWLGAVDDGNDTDAVFAWVTGEPWGFAAFAPGQPDDDASLGGDGECLHVVNAAGQWNDTSCSGGAGFVIGRVCEYAAIPCGDGVVQAAAGETCDDGNRVGFDGCSATCRAETLFFSEYVEGTGSNKAIEIANPGATPVALTGCALRLYSNGAAAPSATLNLTQTIGAHDVLAWCNPSASAALLARCDVTSGTGGVVNWNGDDGVELVCGGVTVDMIGRVPERPVPAWGTGLTSTLDHTLRRRCTVTAGDTVITDPFDPATEWDGLAADTFDNVGSYHCP
ncbi:MAG: Ig-like domain-containing protein [Kofleriaceae bacterium]